MSRTLFYCRVAFSAICGIACVLLIVLWVRSYAKFDHTWVPVSPTRTFCVITCKGYASFGTPPVKYFRDRGSVASWDHSSGDANKRALIARTQSCLGVRWTTLQPAERGLQVIVPIWMLIAFVLLIGTAPFWLPKLRFSLRTLLITTTIIAAALGLAIWS